MFRWESEYVATHCPFSSVRGPGRMNGVLAGNSWPRPQEVLTDSTAYCIVTVI